jgi:hypothetical protein
VGYPTLYKEYIMASLYESITNFFSFDKKGKEDKETEIEDEIVSFVEPANLDGAVVSEGGRVSYNYNQDITASNEIELIRRYREAARIPEVSEAIDEIINECVSENAEGDAIAIDMEKLELSEAVKKKITEEFSNVLNLFEFKDRGTDYLRKWYVDGRIYFHKIIDKSKPGDGIKELRFINPISIKKIVETEKVKDGKITLTKIKREYFQYQPAVKSKPILMNDSGATGPTQQQYTPQFSQQTMQVIQVSPEAIAYVTSGMYDEDFSTVLSPLHPALRVSNQLKTLEDSLVIYRLARAPERRIFYIDVGGLAKPKADQYVKDMMSKFKNNISYDAMTGEIKDQRRHLSMMEDFWIPRRDNGKTTEITTLPGGQNLSQLEDVEYFLKKMYKSLKVPYSRFMTDSPVAGLGRSSEISREEIKFQKFIDRLRNRFGMMILDVLGSQLKLKNVVSEEDWKDIKGNITLDWAKDNFFTEMKEAELIRERMLTLQQVDPYVGKYLSRKYVFTNVLRMTDEEMRDVEKDNEQDRKDHPELYADLMDPNNPNGVAFQQNQPLEVPPEEDDTEDNRQDKQQANKDNKGTN